MPTPSSAPPATGLRRHIDITAAVQRAEVALRDKDGKVLAVVFRNFDGVYGQRILASAALKESELTNDWNKMASERVRRFGLEAIEG